MEIELDIGLEVELVTHLVYLMVLELENLLVHLKVPAMV